MMVYEYWTYDNIGRGTLTKTHQNTPHKNCKNRCHQVRLSKLCKFSELSFWKTNQKDGGVVSEFITLCSPHSLHKLSSSRQNVRTKALSIVKAASEGIDRCKAQGIVRPSASRSHLHTRRTSVKALSAIGSMFWNFATTRTTWNHIANRRKSSQTESRKLTLRQQGRFTVFAAYRNFEMIFHWFFTGSCPKGQPGKLQCGNAFAVKRLSLRKCRSESRECGLAIGKRVPQAVGGNDEKSILARNEQLARLAQLAQLASTAHSAHSHHTHRTHQTNNVVTC